MTDGSSSIRLVGFDTKKQEKLAEMQQSKQSVRIDNCKIVPSKYNCGELEVIISSCTTVASSSKNFNVSTIATPLSADKLFDLKTVADMEHFNVVDVIVKVRLL